jgi:hypothetical protein
MKYVRTPGFLIDLRRLPDEHRKLFVQAVHEVLRPALDAGAHKGAVPWPRALRVHRIGANCPQVTVHEGGAARRMFPRGLGIGQPCEVPQRPRMQPAQFVPAGSCCLQVLLSQEPATGPAVCPSRSAPIRVGRSIWRTARSVCQRCSVVRYWVMAD